MSQQGRINRLAVDICDVLGLDPDDVFRLTLDRTSPIATAGSVTALLYMRKNGNKYIDDTGEPAFYGKRWVFEYPQRLTVSEKRERENDP